MKYSLQEALRELRSSKKNLKESVNFNGLDSLDKDALIQVYEEVSGEYDLVHGEEAQLFDFINECFEDDGYEEFGINFMTNRQPDFGEDINGDYYYYSEDEVVKVLQPYKDSFFFLEPDPDLQVVDKSYVVDYIKDLVKENGYSNEELDEIIQSAKEYTESVQENPRNLENSNLNEDIQEKDNFEAAVKFYQTNPKNLNNRQLANNLGRSSQFKLPDHLVSAILNGVTDYAEANEFDGNDAIAELRANIGSLKGKSLNEVLSFLDEIEFAENWNTFDIVDSNNNLIFDNVNDLDENDWYASISDLCYNGPLKKYSNKIVKNITIDSNHSDNMDARKITIVI